MARIIVTGKVRAPAAGFTYLGLIFLIAIFSISLAAVGTMWGHAAKREKEAELLFIGNQYRQAIGLYYNRTPGPVKKYPESINDLLLDPRYPSIQRYLRKNYIDPVTGGKEWGIVRAPDGGVMGVYSLSDAQPIKTGGFSSDDAAFTGKEHYSDWRFVYLPPSAVQQINFDSQAMGKVNSMQ